MCGKTETELCLPSVFRACAIRNVSRYVLPCYQKKKQNNKTCICCGAVILIVQEVWCSLPVQIVILWLLVCLPGNTVRWVLHDLRVLPLLKARLCDSQLLHPIVPVPWHLGGGMMQRQPWRWSQLWCNAAGIFQVYLWASKASVCQHATLPFSQSAPHLSVVRQPYMNRYSQNLLETFWCAGLEKGQRRNLIENTGYNELFSQIFGLGQH